jgi:hypothetical protein
MAGVQLGAEVPHVQAAVGVQARSRLRQRRREGSLAAASTDGGPHLPFTQVILLLVMVGAVYSEQLHGSTLEWLRSVASEVGEDWAQWSPRFTSR